MLMQRWISACFSVLCAVDNVLLYTNPSKVWIVGAEQNMDKFLVLKDYALRPFYTRDAV